MNKRNVKKKFAQSFQGNFGKNDSDSKEGNVPYAILKAARHSGQLNLSGRSLTSVPDRVYRINIDVPDEAKSTSMADTDERWWDQVDLRKLILASNQLSEISGEIKNLPALNVLDIHDNVIEKLPEEIGELKELSKLHLSHNKLSCFPNSFCNLVALKSLLLSGNVIEKLPEDIGYLVNVEELDLAQNKLTGLPESIGNMKCLKKLNLTKNQITDLPVTFEYLTGLRDLDLSSNKLTTLPSGFGKLTSLEIVECRYNLISSISKFTESANIKQLFLGYNRLRELPEDIFGDFPQLVSLDLRDNSISKLPESLLELKMLERIDLTNNNISGLPYVLGHMKLKALTLDGNPMRGIRRDIIARGTQAILEYLRSRMPIPEPKEEIVESPKKSETVADNNSTNESQIKPARFDGESKVQSSDASKQNHPKEPSKAVVDQYLIATTKVLTHNNGSSNIPESVWLPGAKISNINFSKNTLSEFPSEIMQYKESLSEINISHNRITALPALIGDLSKLTFIDLSNNMLQALPEEIKVLPHLLQIVLSFNRFTTMPKPMFEMKSLQTILMANNQLSDIDVDGLLQLKTVQTLDLSNNNIARIPPQLGNVEWLKSLNLDGNSFRSPRPQILMKGTQFILGYLRDRIPT
ncbi:leucine-rich repeat-containing protein 40-like [Clytia hemisphaerica]